MIIGVVLPSRSIVSDNRGCSTFEVHEEDLQEDAVGGELVENAA